MGLYRTMATLSSLAQQKQIQNSSSRNRTTTSEQNDRVLREIVAQRRRNAEAERMLKNMDSGKTEQRR